MRDLDPTDPRLGLVSGLALVVLGSPLVLGSLAPVVVMFVAIGAYGLVAEYGDIESRWKVPLVGVAGAAMTFVVVAVYAALLPPDAGLVLPAVGAVASGVGLVLALRAARAV